MPEFSYEATGKDEPLTKGQVSADSVAAAVSQLEAAGLLVTSIQKLTPPVETAQTTTDSLTHPAATSGNDQPAMRQRIAEVLQQRDVLAPALAAFAEELPPGRSRRELRGLVAKMQSDATVDEIYNSGDRTVSWLLLLDRGTDSQRLLSDLFDEAMRESESQTQWNRAFIYPTIVVLGSLGVLIFLCVAVVPAFASIYDDFELDLPTMTLWLVAISKSILRIPVTFALAIFTALAGVYLFIQTIRIWGLPGRLGSMFTMGSSWQVTAVARFTRQLVEALSAGLELPAALRLAGGIGPQRSIQRIALQLADEAQLENFELNKSSAARRLPSTMVHALQAGFGGKPCIPLLRQLAELYTTRVRDRHNWSTGFMAQFAIVGVGLTVGFVVIAIFQPMVQLINGLTG